jgi:hypothetical protein
MPTLAVVSKGPRSFQLRGPFALPGLRHDIAILLGKHGFESMSDNFLPRLKATTLDRLVDCSAEKSRNPDVHFPVTPLTAGFSEALNGGCSFSSRHDAHPSLS